MEVMPSYNIRQLTREDGPAYKQLRMQSLQSDPSAFLSTFETENQLHEGIFANHLDSSYHPPFLGYFGIFEEDTLLGYLQVSSSFLEKESHIATIYNVYMNPKYRGQGLARMLFEHVFEVLKDHGNIERIFLTCTASNKRACRFYQKLGFRRYAVRVQAVKWQGKYDDEIEMVKML